MYLKWVGGKTSLSKSLISQFPKNIDSYIEPFAGSAAMYFRFHSPVSTENSCFNNQNHSFKTAKLYDINSHLINCHITVRDNLESLINKLEKLTAEHNSYQDENKTKDFYVSIRDKVTQSITEANKIELAANFLYINKTCFNGIWRVNKSGRNNVPFNNKLDIKFDYQDIRKASIMLQNCSIENQNFKSLDIKKEGKTFVYLDPPYYPLSITSNFTGYNSAKVNDKELLSSLLDFCKDLDKKGILWMMSNSSAIEVKEAFSEWNIGKIEAHRFVKAIKTEDTDNKAKRSKIEEFVITNYKE